MSTSSQNKEAFDPSRRRLCPDGACIGLLDEKGRCRECGLQAGAGSAAPTPRQTEPDAESGTQETQDEIQDETNDEAQEAEADGDDVPGAEANGFDPRRRLCPDGDCLGVIGADGRCSVCRRTADG